MTKKRITATVDESIKARLDNKTEINTSQLVNQLLTKYVAEGETSTVALQLLRSDLQDEIKELETERELLNDRIQSKENDLEKVNAKIKERRSAGYDGIDEIVAKVENGMMNPAYIDEQNPIIQENASKAGVSPSQYVQEVEARI